jgi:hypothetical protein
MEFEKKTTTPPRFHINRRNIRKGNKFEASIVYYDDLLR